MLLEWLYLITLIASMLVSALLTGNAWFHRDTAVGRWFFMVGLVSTLGIISYLLFSISEQESVAFVFVQLRLTVLGVGPIVFLLFLSTFTGYGNWLWRYGWLTLMIVPVITIGLVWFSPNLIWGSWEIVSRQLINVESSVYTGWFFVHTLHGIVLAVLGYIYLVRQIMTDTPMRQRQARTILVGLLFPTGVVFLPTLGLTRGLPNPYPVSLVIMVIAFAWALYRQQLLTLPPLAYQNIIENMQDAVLVVDKHGKLALVNAPAQRLLSLPPNAMAIGYPIQEIFRYQPPELASHLTNWQSRFETSVTIDSEEHIFDVNISPIHSHGDTLDYGLFVLRDITESRRIEERLQRSEAKYRHLVETSHQGMTIMQVDPIRVRFVSKPMETLLGYSIDETLSATPEQLTARIHPDDQERAFNSMGRWLGGEPEQTYGIAYRVIRKDGEIRWMNIASKLIEYDGKTAIQSIYNDVTDRVIAEEALKASEKRLRQINQRYDELVKNIPALVYRVRLTPDLDYSFDYLSPRCKEFTGYEVEDVLKNPHLLPENFTEEAAAKHWDLMVDSMNTLAPYQFEEAMTVAGEQRWIRLQSHPQKLENGDVIWDGLHLDITDQKLAQQRELELKLEKERRRLLTIFFENAAHEFRTPLAVINSSAYLISRFDDPERRTQKAEQITAQVQRITRLVDSLLLMTRLESNGTLASNLVDLGEILQSVCGRAESICTSGHDLRYDIAPDLPSISGDVNYLDDALQQIIDNACRFTPDGGEIEVKAANNGACIYIEIRDSGPGIPQEMLPHIFETFWRQDAAHSTPGFGLGLPIAQRIVERHGGKISVESEVGQGTTVHISLPIALQS